MSIRVGQIYQYEDVGKFVISNIQDNEEFYNPSIIWQDGSVDTLKAMRKSMKIYGKLIAEYPTWQEAVNSPEFKGEK
jgi:hypothetical protein